MPMWLKSDGKGDGLPIRAVGATAVGITGMFVGAFALGSSRIGLVSVSRVKLCIWRFRSPYLFYNSVGA